MKNSEHGIRHTGTGQNLEHPRTETAVPLFRPEAVRAQRSQMTGEVLLSHRTGGGAAALFAGVAVLALAAFFVWGEYTRRAVGSGFIAPAEGVVQIQAPQAGVVTEAPVVEGARIKAGQVLFVLSADRSGAGDAGYQLSIASSMKERLVLIDQQRASASRAAQAEEQAQRDRANAMAQERARLGGQLHDALPRAQVAVETRSRYQGLLEQGLVTRDQVSAMDAQAAERTARLQALQREDLGLQRELAGLHHAIQAAQARQAAADQAMAREAAGLREQLLDVEARRRVVLTAPRDGVVTLVQAVQGSAVAPGRPLATLLKDEAPLQCTLYAPSRTVGFLKPGTPVWMRVGAFPHQKFGHLTGQVLAVSAYPAPVHELSGLAGANDAAAEPVYAVTVRLDAQAMRSGGSSHALRAGMKVEADFMLERRRLWEWALEPVLSLPRAQSS